MFIVMQKKSLFWIKNDVFIFRIYNYLKKIQLFKKEKQKFQPPSNSQGSGIRQPHAETSTQALKFANKRVS